MMPTLQLHVAGLAKPDQVLSDVGLFCCREQPERLDVVDGQRFPDVLAAFGALLSLIRNDNRAGTQPSSPSIGGRATNPVGRLLAVRLPMLVEASASAEPRGAILTREPRRLPERRRAAFAHLVMPTDPARVCRASHILGLEGVRWTVPSAPLVAFGITGVAQPQARGFVPRPSTSLRAEAGRACAVWLHAERVAADLTCFFYRHVRYLARFGADVISYRTTDIACRRIEQAQRQGDIFRDAVA